MTVRTRFAPSPTGYLHIGGARTALFSWLYARKHGGQFVLRIEDTDRERSTEASVQAILDGMEWMGLDYDEGPFYQTQRMDRYAEIIRQLMGSGHAYYCYCSKEELETMRAEQMARKAKPRYDGRYRDFTGTPPAGVEPVIRFKNPLQGAVVIDDLIKGKVLVENSELDDLIIARADGTPTYNLSVVVDDMDMGITHAIRGDDHLNNAPRQLNILQALGATPPVYAHVPMILGEDGKRLSKRHGAVSVMQYKEDGFLPEALVNYLVRLGWSHGDQELFTREEMIALFELGDVNKAASTFNPQKLLWINEQYLKHTPAEQVAEVLQQQLDFAIPSEDSPSLAAVIEVLRDRSKTLNEMAVATRYFYLDPEAYDDKARVQHFDDNALQVFKTMHVAFTAMPEWTAEQIKQRVKSEAANLGLKMGQVGMPLRLSATGGTDSPDIGITLEIIGKPATLRRIEKAIEIIEKG